MRNDNVKLLPRPHHMVYKDGCFQLKNDANICFCGDAELGGRVLLSYENRIRDTLFLSLNTRLENGETHIATGGIYLIEDGQILENNPVMDDGILYSEALGKINSDHAVSAACLCESFRIDIDEEKITIRAAGYNGFLYALSALLQLFSQKGQNIPCLEIVDYPDIPRRAYYLDQTRGRVLHLSELKKIIDKLWLYRYNELQLYIEHTYAFKDIPELWQDESFFTAEDILELDEYCAQRGIEFIPSLSCFGHLYKLLRTKEYGHLCELGRDDSSFSFIDRMQHHTMAVDTDEGLHLIEKMLLEYMSLFRSKKVNICCDETFDLCEGRSSYLLKEKSKKEVYISYVARLCQFVIDHGKTPMVWGDVMAGDTRIAGMLPGGTICLSWGYGTQEKDDKIAAISGAGIPQYVCPGVCGWNHLINMIENSYINIKTMAGFAHKYKALGFMVTDWGDYGHINHPWFSVPGMIFGACFGWNKEFCEQGQAEKEILDCGKEKPKDGSLECGQGQSMDAADDFTLLCQDISRLEYGDASGKLVGLLNEASSMVETGWGELVRFYEDAKKTEYAGNCGTKPLDVSENFERSKERNESETEKLEENKQDEGAFNDKFDEIKAEIEGVMQSSRSVDKSKIRLVLNAIEGIRIFNGLGIVEGLGCVGNMGEITGSTGPEKVDRRKLAADLKCWELEYEQIFLENSKESDLPKFQEILHWYEAHAY